MLRRSAQVFPLLPLFILATTLVSAPACDKKKGWDWRETFAVECTVVEGRGLVSAHAQDDLLEGTVVEVAELPELDYTVNRSGVYMRDASLVPLDLGAQTLTFKATNGSETAATTCAVERPELPATATVIAAKSKPFARAEIVVSITPKGGSAKLTRLEVDLQPDGTFLIPFKAWKPQSPTAGGVALVPDEEAVVHVPLPAVKDGSIDFGFSNLDGNVASYTLVLTELRPWVDDDTSTLKKGAEGGLSWAVEAVEDRPKGEAIRSVLVDENGEVLAHTGPMRALSEVERVAQVTLTEEEAKTCKYGSADGRTAEMALFRERALVVVRAAKSGEELARKEFTANPGACPDEAEFLFLSNADSGDNPQSGERGIGGQVIGDTMPAVEAWLEKAMKG